MKRSWVLHPFLVALYPVLLLASRNFHAVPVREMITSAALILVVATALWLALRWRLRDGAKAGLIVSTALILFFSFGRCVHALERLGVDAGRNAVEGWVLAAEAGVMVAVVVWVGRASALSRRWTSGANAGAVALVGISLVSLLIQARDDFKNPPPRLASRSLPATVARPARLPDIYFIVLDAYGRSDVLKSMYGFDNSGFLDRLERKGFQVARQSHANYCQTALSISATLNMHYHDDLAGSRSGSRSPLRERVAESLVFRALQPHGYRLAAFATGFAITDLKQADFYFAPPGNLSEGHALLAETTPLWLLLGLREAKGAHRLHRERIINVFNRLPEVAAIDGPTFCLAHVVAPHPPFVFGADGGDTSAVEKQYTLSDGITWSTLENHGDARDYARRYRAQVQAITDKAEAAIDQILARSPEPPIIILQGDHGPASQFDTNSDQPNDLAERMGILNACYLPGDGKPTIYPTMTPVNTFRVVLDRYFGARLGLLDDRSDYSGYTSPYRLTDVTVELLEPH